MRWPRKIPAGEVCTETAMTIDILPTFAHLAGVNLPPNPIDGLDIWPLMSGEPDAKCPHEAFCFYWMSGLEAVRSGKWILHFPHAYRTLNGRPGGTGGVPVKYDQARTELALFDLEKDISQTQDVSAQHPNVVERLKALAEKFREDLGDGDRPGKGQRPHAIYKVTK